MRSGLVRDLALHFTVTEGMVANLRMMGHMTEISSTENASKDINHGTCANEVIARLANSITGATPPLFSTCPSDVTIYTISCLTIVQAAFLFYIKSCQPCGI